MPRKVRIKPYRIVYTAMYGTSAIHDEGTRTHNYLPRRIKYNHSNVYKSARTVYSLYVHVQDPSLPTDDGHHEVTGHHVYSSLLVVILKRTVSRDYLLPFFPDLNPYRPLISMLKYFVYCLDFAKVFESSSAVQTPRCQ